jgi:hypothetical protein
MALRLSADKQYNKQFIASSFCIFRLNQPRGRGDHGEEQNYSGSQMRVWCGAIRLVALFASLSDQERSASKQLAHTQSQSDRNIRVIPVIPMVRYSRIPK